jgi:hypothetical protein
MPNKVDDVATNSATATVPKPLFDTGRETIISAANQTRSYKIAALSPEPATATGDFILNPYGARAFDLGIAKNAYIRLVHRDLLEITRDLLK